MMRRIRFFSLFILKRMQDYEKETGLRFYYLGNHRKYQSFFPSNFELPFMKNNLNFLFQPQFADEYTSTVITGTCIQGISKYMIPIPLSQTSVILAISCSYYRYKELRI